MVPSGPIAHELWISGMASSESGGRTAKLSKLRSSVSRRGPLCGLRPECWLSIWYCGLPATAPPAAAAAAGDGEATAAAPGDGDAAGLAAAAGDAAGEAAGDAAGAPAGFVGAAAGALVTGMDSG